MIEENLWPVVTKHFTNKPYIFQEDNAPCHKSRACETWKTENRLPVLLWPAQSPDLSPIENIWLIMKNKIKNRLYLVHNVEDLKAELLRAWFEIPVFHVQRLYSSLPRRCRQVLIQKGDITKY